MNLALEALCAMHKPSAPRRVGAPHQRKITLCENAQCVALPQCVARLPNAPRSLKHSLGFSKLQNCPFTIELRLQTTFLNENGIDKHWNIYIESWL